ncbi:NAD(P)-binding protein [Acinetobacter baumannii]|uniref:NAD(P)-binding protein n=1 Tax=Acinetobacter baumannii TaxID=470 RepID=UPI0020182425|nr:NAD(P)-binding protein [Acinetobacter baumannii]UQL43253.1 NAD(P)-binding protein [Acinetobacter baumannii]
MTAQMKTNASAKKAVNSPSHIYDTFIVGAGISGIAAAIRLDKLAIPTIKLLKKQDVWVALWRENTYPGCGCDVPSALYSYSFAPSAKWSHLFARQPEILSYLEDVRNEFNITSKIEFNNELLNAAWDDHTICGYLIQLLVNIYLELLFLLQAQLPKPRFTS